MIWLCCTNRDLESFWQCRVWVVVVTLFWMGQLEKQSLCRNRNWHFFARPWCTSTVQLHCFGQFRDQHGSKVARFLTTRTTTTTRREERKTASSQDKSRQGTRRVHPQQQQQQQDDNDGIPATTIVRHSVVLGIIEKVLVVRTCRGRRDSVYYDDCCGCGSIHTTRATTTRRNRQRLVVTTHPCLVIVSTWHRPIVGCCTQSRRDSTSSSHCGQPHSMSIQQYLVGILDIRHVTD